ALAQLSSVPTRRSSDLADVDVVADLVERRYRADPAADAVASDDDHEAGGLVRAQAQLHAVDPIVDHVVAQRVHPDVVAGAEVGRSEEHTSELQSRGHLV